MHGMINTPMSTTSHSHHHHKHSGELDVFEATRYFSREADAHKTIARRAMREDRRSLDMPLQDAKAPLQPHQRVVDQLTTHNKVKCKQPSSPGGKLASFLNYFFLQLSNSKKSKKSSPSSSSSSSKLVKGDHKDQERESKKRTSMHESKSRYCSSCSNDVAFRTPSLNSSSQKRTSEGFKDNTSEVNYIWRDELNVNKKDDKLEEEDDQLSDASSDLFELKIDLYEFGEIDSSGLPVYGSADHVGVISSTRERFASTIAY